MFSNRILIVALTLTFLLGVLITRGVGMLEATVAMCFLLYMILETREEPQSLRSLETRGSSLSR